MMIDAKQSNHHFKSSGLYYKQVTIVNDASSGVNKLKASLNDAARGVIYDRHAFIIQATGFVLKIFNFLRNLPIGQNKLECLLLASLSSPV